MNDPYRGLVTRVARKLGLGQAHVSRVKIGQRDSKRVRAALIEEMKLMDLERAEAAKEAMERASAKVFAEGWRKEDNGHPITVTE